MHTLLILLLRMQHDIDDTLSYYYSAIRIAYAVGHCHTGCVQMEMWRDNQLLCTTRPTYEDGYIVQVDPCVWDMASSPRMQLGSSIRIVAYTNASCGHWGQMAHWQLAVAFE